MSIDNDLLAFADTQAPWMRDCLRRICTQSDLTKADIQEILTNLKSTEGLVQAGTLEQLTSSHLATQTTSSRASTVLISISDVQNANRLAPNQVLKFAEQGITLIYGYNGSGKTGYGRILRQVCRSRHEKQEPILGNVYAGNTVPASAQIKYKTAGVTAAFTWVDGSPSPDELSLISVFDATTAPLYADQQNKIEFLPLGLDVLPRLAKVCEQLSSAIDGEVRALDAKVAIPLPKVESASHVQFLNRLSDQTTPSQIPTEGEIKTLFTWSPSDDTALEAVQGEIRQLSEPAAQSAQLMRLIGTIEGFNPKMTSAFNAFAPTVISGIQQKTEAAKAARTAATIAATGRFTNDTLGESPTTAAWRRLYQAAEAFSAEIYPDEEFPATGKDRVCLLCQQTIGEAAQDRFQRFKEFLQDTSQQDAVRAEQEVASTLLSVSRTTMPLASDIDGIFKELTDTKPTYVTLRDSIRQQCLALAALKSELVRCIKGEAEFAEVPSVDATVLIDIDNAILTLKAEKQAFDDLTKDTAILTKFKNQIADLVDRRNCAGNLAIFVARRTDLCTRSAWKRCRKQCDTTAISRKSSQLRDAYLTQGFHDAVMKEVRDLGLDYLPIRVEGRTTHGVGYIGVALSKTGREPTSRILSEGEFRGLALACFFAEIGTINGHDGIVVDDPVSSLDHLHVEQVAVRLVQEAKVRPQVIVFTHDLAFYYDLWMAAAEAGIDVYRNWVHKTGSNGFGNVTPDDGPWQVKTTRERMTFLDEVVRKLPDQSSTLPDEYLMRSEAFYSKLRETWERLVEERLLNGVVGRFQPQVATQMLKGVSVTDEDYRKVFFAMKRASEFSGHDRPVGRPPVTRTKSEMTADLEELRGYDKDLNKRVASLVQQRKALENPPAASLSDSSS